MAKEEEEEETAAAMASVTGHCIWFHGKWALSYSWVEIVKISRGYPPLNWIAATCVYPPSFSSIHPSRSLLLRLSPLTHSLALFVAAGAQLRRFISTLRARSRAHSLAMRRSRRKRSRSARSPPPPARRKTQPRRNAEFHRRRDEEGRENGVFRGFDRARLGRFLFTTSSLGRDRRTKIFKRVPPRLVPTNLVEI